MSTFRLDDQYPDESDLASLKARTERLEAVLREVRDGVADWQTHCDYRAEPAIKRAVRLIDDALSDKGGAP